MQFKTDTWTANPASRRAHRLVEFPRLFRRRRTEQFWSNMLVTAFFATLIIALLHCLLAAFHAATNPSPPQYVPYGSTADIPWPRG